MYHSSLYDAVLVLNANIRAFNLHEAPSKLHKPYSIAHTYMDVYFGFTVTVEA